MGEQTARWDLAIAGEQPPLRPLRPQVLYQAPVPRTKLEATVPDGDVTGTLQLNRREVTVSGWRGTVGHNCRMRLEVRDPRGRTPGYRA